MSLMAKTANFAVVVRPPKVMKSKLGELASRFLNRGTLKQLLTACAINPLEDVHLVIISGDVTSNFSTVFAKGSFTKESVDNCVGKLQSALPSVKVARTGDIVELSMGELKLYARWIIGGVLASPIKARVDMSKLAGPSNELSAKFASFTADAFVSFAATGAALKDERAGMLVNKLPGDARPTQAHGNLVIDNGLKLDVSAGMPSAAAAKKAQTTFQEVLDGLKKLPVVSNFIGGAKLEAVGSDVRLSFALSDDQITMLMAMAKMVM